jgi:hypothetical protein
MKDPKLEQPNKRVRDEKYAVDCKHHHHHENEKERLKAHRMMSR